MNARLGRRHRMQIVSSGVSVESFSLSLQVRARQRCLCTVIFIYFGVHLFLAEYILAACNNDHSLIIASRKQTSKRWIQPRGIACSTIAGCTVYNLSCTCRAVSFRIRLIKLAARWKRAQTRRQTTTIRNVRYLVPHCLNIVACSLLSF